MCGHFCTFVLKSLTDGEYFETILNLMQHYGEYTERYRLNQRRALFYQNIALLDSLRLQLDPLPGEEPYNAVDAISMRRDICYRDNDSPAGKPECNHKMLAELNTLVPRGRREKVDRQLVRSIIGLKHRPGLGIDWSNQLANELHKPVRRRFEKRTVFTKQVDDIWTAN